MRQLCMAKVASRHAQHASAQQLRPSSMPLITSCCKVCYLTIMPSCAAAGGMDGNRRSNPAMQAAPLPGHPPRGPPLSPAHLQLQRATMQVSSYKDPCLVTDLWLLHMRIHAPCHQAPISAISRWAHAGQYFIVAHVGLPAHMSPVVHEGLDDKLQHTFECLHPLSVYQSPLLPVEYVIQAAGSSGQQQRAVSRHVQTPAIGESTVLLAISHISYICHSETLSNMLCVYVTVQRSPLWVHIPVCLQGVCLRVV
jgi:hypothetical protein